MGLSGVQDPRVAPPPPPPPPPLEAPPLTRTDGVAPERSDVVEAYAEPAPLLTQVPGDRVLSAPPPVVAPMEVLGLGPLAADSPALQLRVTRLVRAQGVAEVTRLLAEARSTAEGLQSSLLRHGRSAAHPAELARRIRVMEAFLPSLAAERDEVQAKLQPHVVAEAHAALDAAEARVDQIGAQYFGANGYGRPEALGSLRADAQALLQARNEALQAQGPARAEAAAAYTALHREVSARHPILASFDLATPEVAKLEDLALDEVPAEEAYMARPLDEPIRSMLADVRGSVADMRQRLADDPEVVWRLPGVVEATLVRHDVPADGMVAAYARDGVRTQARNDAVTRGFVSVLSVGLGIAAALPSGGASLAAASAAATAVDGYQLYLSVEEYRLFAAASGTAVDRRDALSDQVPSAGWLALDALGAAAGAAGTVAALRKTAFTRLLAEQGPVGDMARGLELRLGVDRAATLVDELGAGEADLLFRGLARETWNALAELPAARFESAVQALGADGLRGLEDALGPTRAGAWIAGLSEEARRGLGATRLGREEVARIAARFTPEEVSHLAPTLKGRGVAELAANVGDARLMVAADHVVVDGQLRLGLQEVLRSAVRGDLAARRAGLATLKARSPSLRGLGTLTMRELRGLEDYLKDGSLDLVGRLAGGQGRSRARVKAVLDELRPSKAVAEVAPTALELGSGADLERLRLHLAEHDRSVPRSRGIGGAHNMVAFEAAVKETGAVVVSKTAHPSLEGVYQVEYKMPALDGKEQPTGELQAGSFEKTIHDPSVWRDEDILRLGLEAAEDAASKGVFGRTWHGTASNGMRFHGYSDANGRVTSVYPEVRPDTD
ncbi:MAG: EndoU domain-containing protein [Myxococcales bacterium]|nr:EndoU domain-containing protein [Myxococcales bacterium]